MKNKRLPPSPLNRIIKHLREEFKAQVRPKG